MKILPPSQIKNLPIIEDVLEELRLSILDHIQEIGDVLNLYSLDTNSIKNKLNLLGLSSVSIGKFINIDLSDDDFRYISPTFYKGYRKLNQHRGNKMSMDYIFHSAGMMNTLVRSNSLFYNQDIFNNKANFFEFNTFRDNQFEDLDCGDGYIIVPYSSNRSQVLKQYLAKNPIIFEFLPAGYTFIFLSEYRNGYSTGVLQYDNLLNLEDSFNPEEYLKPIYWENFITYPIIEEIILPDGSTLHNTHNVQYYDPYLWRDEGRCLNVVEYPRYTSDSVYNTTILGDFTGYLDYVFHNAQLYFDAYNDYIINEAVISWSIGLEADLNNTLNYKDIWVGDYLLSTLKGSNVYPEYYDHVKGIIAPSNPSSSLYSLYKRGETIASQYSQRENKVVSVLDHDIQLNKKEIITDRREIDLQRIVFSSDVSLILEGFYDRDYTYQLLYDIFALSPFEIDSILDSTPSVLVSSLEEYEADVFYNSIIDKLSSDFDPDSTDVVISIVNGDGVVIKTNRKELNKHIEKSSNTTTLLSRSITKVVIEVEAHRPDVPPEPTTNGYIYDASSDTLTPANYDDENETVEV